jgi:hypothetical protein
MRRAVPGLARHAPRLALALALALAAGGCDSARKSLGLGKSAPDEFNVVSRAPLEMPPSLDVLPKPEPGIDRPQELQPQQAAYYALMGTTMSDIPLSAGEGILLAEADAGAAEPGIRDLVDVEDTELANYRSFMQTLQFWREYPDPTEVLIDPAAERARLQNNAALGLPPNEGDFETVIVKPEEKAIFEGLF